MEISGGEVFADAEKGDGIPINASSGSPKLGCVTSIFKQPKEQPHASI